MQRLDAYLTHQDFCSPMPMPWPEDSAITVLTSQKGQSCKDTCMKESEYRPSGPTLSHFLGRARLYVESALWSHVCVVIVMEDIPPQLATPPPKVAHDDAGSLMESCLSWCGRPPPGWLPPPT